MDTQKGREEHLRHGPKQELVNVTMTFTMQSTPAWSHVHKETYTGEAYSLWQLV